MSNLKIYNNERYYICYLACALASDSDVNFIDSIKEDYRKAFIKGEFNKAILEDLEIS